MMTQDAMPKDDRLIEKLVEPLQGEVAVAYARQLPREDSTPVESYTREFNYPAKSRIKSAADLDSAGRSMRNWAGSSDIRYLMKI